MLKFIITNYKDRISNYYQCTKFNIYLLDITEHKLSQILDELIILIENANN